MRTVVRRDRPDPGAAFAVLGGYLVALAALLVVALDGQSFGGAGLSHVAYDFGLPTILLCTAIAAAGAAYALHVRRRGWTRRHAAAAVFAPLVLGPARVALLSMPGMQSAGYVTAVATASLLFAGVRGLRRGTDHAGARV